MILCLGVKILGVDYVIDILNKENSKANVYEEENIDYLVMIFNFYTNGTVSISMKAMVGDLVDDMGIKVRFRRLQ